jgi:hypothetical protein
MSAAAPFRRHQHRWNLEEIREVYRICRDTPNKAEALRVLRTRFSDTNEYTDGALKFVRKRYEKRNDGSYLEEFVPGQNTAAFGSQGKIYDNVWSEQDWRRRAVAEEPAAPAAAAVAVAEAAPAAPALPAAFVELDPANNAGDVNLIRIRALEARLEEAEHRAREARRRELHILIFLKRAQITHVRFVPHLFPILHYEEELRILEEELATL